MLTVPLTIGAVSCSAGDQATLPKVTSSARRPTTTTSMSRARPSTSTTARPVADEVVARYIGFWDARFAANQGLPNPDDPALRDYATGEQLETVIRETRANLERGLAFRRAANPSGIQRVIVIEVSGDHAVVQECVVADGVIIRRDTGDVVNGAVATHSVRGELVRIDGAWKVSATQLIQRWEGVAGCARAS